MADIEFEIKNRVQTLEGVVSEVFKAEESVYPAWESRLKDVPSDPMEKMKLYEEYIHAIAMKIIENEKEEDEDDGKGGECAE